MSVFDFSQRVLLLTGANGGIGRGIARLFAEAGAKLVMADINLQGAEEFAHRLDPAGGRVAVVKLDASSTGDVERAIELCTERFGRLDFLVTAAAIYEDHMFEAM